MPRPSLRSRSFRRVRINIPGGASIIHYFKREPSPARCGNCGAVLHGVASRRPAVLKKLSKSRKTTSRVFGGNLCPSCARESLKARARQRGGKR